MRKTIGSEASPSTPLVFACNCVWSLYQLHKHSKKKTFWTHALGWGQVPGAADLQDWAPEALCLQAQSGEVTSPLHACSCSLPGIPLQTGARHPEALCLQISTSLLSTFKPLPWVRAKHPWLSSHRIQPLKAWEHQGPDPAGQYCKQHLSLYIHWICCARMHPFTADPATKKMTVCNLRNNPSF